MSATRESTVASPTAVVSSARPRQPEEVRGRRPYRDQTSPVDRLLARWSAIAVVAFGAGLLAFAGSFLLPQSYISTAVFVPEQSKSTSLPSSLGALAGEVGIFGGTSGTDSPEFYQRLLTGRAIRTAVLEKPISGVSLFNYFGASGQRDSVERAIKKLSKATSVSIDKAAGTVRIDVELRRPELANAVVTRYLDLVNDFNSNIRRSQAGKRRQFVQAQAEAALADLQRAESNLKDFLSRNRIFSAPELQFERGQLDRRISAAQDLYLGLSHQLQTARIDEVNDTPVISVVDPPFVPVRPSGPRRVVITLMAIFFGVVLSVAYVLFWQVPGRLTGDAD